MGLMVGGGAAAGRTGVAVDGILGSFGRAAARATIAMASDAYAAVAGFARAAPLRFLVYLLVAVSFLFMVAPSLDLTVSGWFVSPAGGFPHARDALLREIRDVNRLVPKVLLGGLGVVILAHALDPHGRLSWLVRPHKAIYVLAVYAVGCGAIVHILKNVVGRARPEHITAFGGSEAFTIPWQISNACIDNCSFSSGEGASAMAMLSAVVLLPARFRRAALVLLVPVAVVFSFNRIAFGSHFLSDVLVSWIIVAITMLALARVVGNHGAAIDRAVMGAVRSRIRRRRAPLPRQTAPALRTQMGMMPAEFATGKRSPG